MPERGGGSIIIITLLRWNGAMGRVTITEAQAREVKRLLYEGYSQMYAAGEVGISQPSVHLISRGWRFASVPWPDGSTGPISKLRLQEIQQAQSGRAGRRARLNERDEQLMAFELTATPSDRRAVEEAAKALARRGAPSEEEMVGLFKPKTRRKPPPG